MNRSADRTVGPVSPSLAQSLRTWKLCRPAAGSKCSLKIFSGVSAATFSISMPPSLETISTGRAAARSSTMPRYNSRAMSQPSSTSTWCTTWPSGPVWIVTSFLPSSRPATCWASSALRTNCTPRWAGIVHDGPFAAAAGVDLGLDDGQTAAQFLKRLGRLGRVADDDARQHGHARIAENMFGLELVNLHRRTPTIRSGGHRSERSGKM